MIDLYSVIVIVAADTRRHMVTASLLDTLCCPADGSKGNEEGLEGGGDDKAHAG
jgi:hypothetical protein